MKLKLKYNFRAFVKFEERNGDTIFNALGVDPNNTAGFDISKLRFTVLADLIWAGRISDQPKLTPEQNLDDLSNLDLPEAIALMGEALAEAFPNDEDGNPKAGGKK